ncbi:hypothetical protein PG985_009643 [Apiospora marii]|uniref:Uncharacterized protein n=1 Tax=Apiospora marii TaxID=335849 RepID=A0ABR1RFX5_9PEZI
MKIAYGPLVHVTTIVNIRSQKYLVNTTVGPCSSPFPVPLKEGQAIPDVATRQQRLIRDVIPGWSADAKWWRLQFRELEDAGWMDAYCFTEAEWLPLDFQLMIAGVMRAGPGLVQLARGLLPHPLRRWCPGRLADAEAQRAIYL